MAKKKAKHTKVKKYPSGMKVIKQKSGAKTIIIPPKPENLNPRPGQPRKWDTPEELEAIMNEYFDWCDDYTENESVYQNGNYVGEREVKRPKPYTVAGLCLWLDIDRLTLINYTKDNKFFNTIRRGKLRIEQQLEEKLLTGFSSGVAFNLKNNFGYKDKTEVDNTIKGGLNLISVLAKARKAREELDKPNS